jgi:hypothetical protein
MRIVRIALLVITALAVGACSKTGATTGASYRPSDLHISYPADGATVATADIVVRGTAPAGAEVRRTVALASDPSTTADGSGAWSMSVNLKLGTNQLKFHLAGLSDIIVNITYDPSATPATSQSLGPTLASDTPTAGATVAPSPSASATSSPAPTPTLAPTAVPTVRATPVKTSAPTASPVRTAAPTATPVKTAAPTAVPPKIKVTFTTFTSPAPRNSDATVGVSTSANAHCAIAVHYKSGLSKAKGLDATNADSSGAVSWTWTIGPSTTAGSWPVTVTCTDANGVSTSATRNIVVS